MRLFGKRKQLEAEIANLREELVTIRNAIPVSDGAKGSTLYEWLVGGLSSAGVAVTERTAMCVSAVYAAVALIAGSITSLPLNIYMRTATGRERVEHDLWWLLNEQPHSSWSAAVFFEYVVLSLLLHGDGFARILRKGPLIIGFIPVHPSRVIVNNVEDRLIYTIADGEGGAKAYDQDDMLHIPGLGFDGLRGMSPIKHALKNAAGTALAADEYSATFFSNGARPDFALTTDQKLTKEQIDLIRDAWDQVHGGSRRAHRPAVLQGGLKVEEITMSAEDAQLIATRKFQVEDIARIFGVPPHMIGHTESSTSWGSGIEQMSIGYVKYTLQRHLEKIEQEINRKCFRTSRYFCEFNTAGLERGDIKTRNESYRIGLGRAGEPGWLTVNEVRRFENLPPVDGGDTLNKGEARNEPTA